jgi:hypothetical protein
MPIEPKYNSPMQIYNSPIIGKNVGMSIKPNLDQAKSVYWTLGDKFWMQIMDGKYHKLGPHVFDEGKHKGSVEPGFFKSLKAGCEFASQHLTEPPTVLFYKDLHKVLCSHFLGRENSTLVSHDQVGSFRNKQFPIGSSKFSSFDLVGADREKLIYMHLFGDGIFQMMIDDYSDDDLKDLVRIVFKNDLDKLGENWMSESKEFWLNQVDLKAKINEMQPAYQQYEDEYFIKTKEKLAHINDYIREVPHEMGIYPFATVRVPAGNMEQIKVTYNVTDPAILEQAVQKIFDRYNQNISEINQLLSQATAQVELEELKDKKLGCIAEVFQLLEWLHPFPDGQGRVDLVLLSKLLVDEGFTPAILDQPYLSSIATRDEWKDYLTQGMEAWKKLATG